MRKRPGIFQPHLGVPLSGTCSSNDRQGCHESRRPHVSIPGCVLDIVACPVSTCASVKMPGGTLFRKALHRRLDLTLPKARSNSSPLPAFPRYTVHHTVSVVIPTVITTS